MKLLHSCEKSVTMYRSMRRNVAQDLNLCFFVTFHFVVLSELNYVVRFCGNGRPDSNFRFLLPTLISEILSFIWDFSLEFQPDLFSIWLLLVAVQNGTLKTKEIVIL